MAGRRAFLKGHRPDGLASASGLRHDRGPEVNPSLDVEAEHEQSPTFRIPRDRPDGLALGRLVRTGRGDPQGSGVGRRPSKGRPRLDPADPRLVGRLLPSSIVNEGNEPARIKEVVLFRVAARLAARDAPLRRRLHDAQPDRRDAGQAGRPRGYTDRKHYKIPQPADATTVYGMLTLSPAGQDRVPAGVHLVPPVRRPVRRPAGVDLEAVLDTEGLTLAPGETWELEELLVRQRTRPHRLARPAGRAAPPGTTRLRFPPRSRPAGARGTASARGSTAEQVLDNLDVIASDDPRPLSTSSSTTATSRRWATGSRPARPSAAACRTCSRRSGGKGFEPAIWVAPFIAEKDSQVFQQHPDWFIKDDARPAARRRPGDLRRLAARALVRARRDPSRRCRSTSKTSSAPSDATGAAPTSSSTPTSGGPCTAASSTTPRPRGSRPIDAGWRRSSGAPATPSSSAATTRSGRRSGLIHGSRSSGDIKRNWTTFAEHRPREPHPQLAERPPLVERPRLRRPDRQPARGRVPLPRHRHLRHRRHAPLGRRPDQDRPRPPGDAPQARARHRRSPPEFDDETLRVGRIPLPGREAICLFNHGDTPVSLSVRIEKPGRFVDFWTGEDLGRREGEFRVEAMPPHSARLLICTPEKTQ